MVPLGFWLAWLYQANFCLRNYGDNDCSCMKHWVNWLNRVSAYFISSESHDNTIFKDIKQQMYIFTYFVMHQNHHMVLLPILNYNLVQRLSPRILNKQSFPDIKILSLPSLEVNTAVFGVHLCKLLVKEVDLSIFQV